jgi:CHAT domain-containing protein
VSLGVFNFCILQKLKPLILLAATFFIIVSSIGIYAEDNPLSLAKASRQFAAEGNIDEAIELSLAALKGLNRQQNKNPLLIAYVNDDLASLYYKQGDLLKALEFSRQAESAANNLKDSHPQKASALAHVSRNYGSIAMAAGQFDLAESQLEQAYALYKALPQAIEKANATADGLITLYLQKDQTKKADEILQENSKRLSRLPDGKQKENLLFEQALQNIKFGLKANNKKAIDNGLSDANKLVKEVKQEKQLEFRELEARVYLFQSNLPAAEEHLKSIIKNPFFKHQSKKHSLTLANAHYYLSFVYILQGKVIEAEPEVLSALKIYRQSVGANNPVVGRTLHQLAIINKNIGRLEDAEDYYKQALIVFEKVFGIDHETIGATRLEYALLLSYLERYAEAKTQSNNAIDLFSKKANKTLQLGFSHSSLGFVYFDEKQYQQAENQFIKAIALMEKARGKNSADLPPGLIKLAEINNFSGKNQRALKNINRAISILEGINALSPYGLIKALSVKAKIMNDMGDIIEAQALSKRFYALLKDRLAINRNSVANLALEEQREVKHLFKQYIDNHFSTYKKNKSNNLAGDLFEVSQYPHMTGTASAIRHMSNRLSVDKKQLAELLKEREEWTAFWEKSQQQVVSELIGDGNNSNIPGRDKIVATISQLDKKIERSFPAFAELTNPKPVTLKTVQQLLDNDEALILQITEETGTTVFYVDKQIIDIQESQLTSSELTERVNKIRHSMDLTRNDIRSYTKMPRYEIEDAYTIYENLLKPFESSLKNKKHLIAVLDGAMQNLPLGVLVANKNSQNDSAIDYRKITFVGHQLAYSVYPSPSSFVALRSLSSNKKASKPFIGIGDPDLQQESSETRSFAFTLDTVAEQIFKYSNPGVLRAIFTPLPETKIELELIAKTLQAKVSDLILGQQATETKVKNTPLQDYNVIGFATHGLLAGEFKGLLEPALVLTPPKQSTDIDNGLLMASEIASLDLNADWIVLSACNTAGPSGRPGAEGLSGLAKSFFHAGARSLLVSHWAIDSTASAFITTRMMNFINQEGLTKSAALKKSITELAFENKTYFAHPAFWGAFVIVGEG